MARGKIHDGGQGGSWEVGLEAESWSERQEQMRKGREKHGKNTTERCEEQSVLFGMSQGAATKRWTMAGGSAGAWTTNSQLFASCGRLISVVMDLFPLPY